MYQIGLQVNYLSWETVWTAWSMKWSGSNYSPQSSCTIGSPLTQGTTFIHCRQHILIAPWNDLLNAVFPHFITIPYLPTIWYATAPMECISCTAIRTSTSIFLNSSAVVCNTTSHKRFWCSKTSDLCARKSSYILPTWNMCAPRWPMFTWIRGSEWSECHSDRTRPPKES